jgi:protein gp37
MAENSKIEWTDHTFNPWTGCQKVSPGCDHCYAEGWAKRSGAVRWGPGEPRRRTTEANWRQPLKWNRQAEAEGRRYQVFCASLADVFDNEVDPQWRTDLFRLIASTQGLDWLLLTKRIGNARQMLRDAAGAFGMDFGEHWRNVWIGATVVNQEEADRDIPKLLAVPARVRFLSIEPMLGPISLDCWPIFGEDEQPLLHWIIAGGESGPGARPAHPDWFRSLRDQCAAAGVPFLFKQWGEWVPYEHSAQPPFLWSQHGREIDGHALPDFESDDGKDQREWHCDWAEQILARRVGKKAAGRLLDGVTHDGFPS